MSSFLSHTFSVFSEVSGTTTLMIFNYRSDIGPLAAAWAPYFDNLDAIIFLAPISGFDEVSISHYSAEPATASSKFR